MTSPSTPRLAIAVSTLERRGASGYLSRTVDDLVERSSPTDRLLARLLLVNLNRPPDGFGELRRVLARHARLDHFVREVRPAAAGHSPNDLRSPHEHRAQLTLDFVTTVRAARETGAPWLLRLEDDVIAAEGYVERILDWAECHFQRDAPWPFVSFFSTDRGEPGRVYRYQAYAPALLFRDDDRLDPLLSAVEEGAGKAPLDWLLRDYVGPGGEHGVTFFPSLFQHIGDVSTFDGLGDAAGARVSPTFTESAHGGLETPAAPASLRARTKSRLRRALDRTWGRGSD